MPRTISNPTRGCGHLKRGQAYIRGVIGSEDGVLPSFVELEPYVPFREMGTDGGFTRGFHKFDGVTAQFAMDELTDFVRRYPGEATDEQARENMVEKALYATLESIPDFEGQRHVDRVGARGPGGQHFGEIRPAQQTDLLMRAGKTHYPDPSDFIDEAVNLGISKAIPLSQKQAPPVVEPGVTRCWIVHPDTDRGWAVIGYAYLQEVIYTLPEDGNVPQYVQDHDDTGRLEVVDIEPPEADDPNTHVDDWVGESTPNGDDNPEDPDDDDGDPRGQTQVMDRPEPDDVDSPADDHSIGEGGIYRHGPVVIYQQEGKATHLVAPEESDTLCGRPVPETLHQEDEADPGYLAKHYDICGTCLTVLKRRLEDNDNGD